MWGRQELLVAHHHNLQQENEEGEDEVGDGELADNKGKDTDKN